MSITAQLLHLQRRALARVGNQIVETFRQHYEARTRELAARLIAGTYAE